MATPEHPCRSGSTLFFVMGMMVVLSLVAMTATESMLLESRTAANHVDSTRALYHAEAGIKIVKRVVENRLSAGETLEQILGNLSISPPSGIEFEPITDFKITVPNRIFSFECIGLSNDARASVVVQFRRRPLLQAGLFGDELLDTQPNVKIYGYDSRWLTDPTPADSNGGGSIGSNLEVELGNHLYLDGNILLGETEAGLLASCTGCTNFVQVQVGLIDPDPLGIMDGGAMATQMEAVEDNNNNGSVAKIINETINLTTGNPETRVITLTSGDYYLTDVDLGSGAVMTIDDTDGPVRIFMAGEFNAQPGSDIVVTSGQPFGLQIYSNSLEDVILKPNGDITAFIYAPGATLQLFPGNDVRGAFWADVIDVSPQNNGNIFLDTSLQDRMLMNSLEIHAWYEQREN